MTDTLLIPPPRSSGRPAASARRGAGRRRGRRSLAFAIVAALLGAVPALGSQVWSPPAASAAETLLSVEDPSSTVLPELNTVDVSGAAVDDAEGEVRAVLDLIDASVVAFDDAVSLEAELGRGLLGLQAETGRLNDARDAAIVARNTAWGEVEAARQRVAVHEGEAGAAQAVLDEVAAEAYISGADVLDLLESPGFTPAGRKSRYLSDVFADQTARFGGEVRARDEALADQAAAQARADAQEAVRLGLEAELAANAAAIEQNGVDAAAARQAQLDATAEQDRLAGVLIDAKAALADARRSGIVVGADFPLVVLDAFVRAVRYEADARPACALDWSLLAAISRVESNHGTYGGSRVDAEGGTSSILGPQLAPGSGFATIADTDGGELDGDPLYDRAVGPMQFIPSSWRIYALDGNGDDDVDPLNYYDAALAAAEHLCRTGADTSTAAGLRQAVLSYNNSDSYVATVASLAGRYQLLSITPT